MRLREVGVREEREEEPRVGRIAERPAKAQLGVGERDVVLPHRRADRLVVRPGRLDDDEARLLAAPDASRGLRHELERPLGRAEVREREEGVRVEDGQRRRVREVVPLATICVPRSAWALPASKSRRTPAAPPRRAAASRSRTAWEIPGKVSANRSARRSVPKPTGIRTSEPQAGQAGGRRIASPQ